MPADRQPDPAAANGRRARRSLLDVRPIDLSIYFPWFNRHRLFVALHLSRYGYEVYGGRSRRTYHVLLMAGRLHKDQTRTCSFDFCGRWSA